MIYFDNAATTKPSKNVMKTLEGLCGDFYANPLSNHNLGIRTDNYLIGLKKELAKKLAVAEDSIIFTSGGTESNNLAIFGAKKAVRAITTKNEHPSVLEPIGQRFGGNVVYIGQVDERLDLARLEQAIEDAAEPTLLSIMQVNNETGTINPVEEIAEMAAKNPNIVFHSDGVQGFGKIGINLKNIDFYSVSGHKIHGLKGSGLLIAKNPAKLNPQILGGGQQNNLRSGTLNTVGAATLIRAALDAFGNMEENFEKTWRLKNIIVEKLQTEFDNISEIAADDSLESYVTHKYKINGSEQSPYILSLSFLGIKGEVLFNALNAEGIYVSTGSTCHSSRKNKDGDDRSMVRFSFCGENTEDEAVYAADKLVEIVKMLS